MFSFGKQRVWDWGDVSGGAGGFCEETVGDGMVYKVCPGLEGKKGKDGVASQASIAAARHAFILSTGPHGDSDSAEKNWNGRSAQAACNWPIPPPDLAQPFASPSVFSNER